MDIIEPTLVIDKDQVIKNVKKILDKAAKSNTRFRPHFKTHQSTEIGEWLKKLGVKYITVSSVRMAECFAKSGWEDITIAFPVNILEINRINVLAKLIQLNLLVESIETVEYLIKNLNHSVNIWINIDVGYHRDGIKWNKIDRILKIAKLTQNSENMVLMGILTHAGHSYKARTKSEILAVHEETIDKMMIVKEKLNLAGLNSIQISVGDTPTASIVEDFSQIDEIRPGNFVFYDLKQVQIGSCTEDEIAVKLACPVVAKYVDRSEILVQGGAIYLSKDSLVNKNGRTIYGYVSKNFSDKSMNSEDVYVTSISQEHGLIKVNNKEFFESIKIGDIVFITPVHSCLATNSVKKFKTLTGKGILVECK